MCNRSDSGCGSGGLMCGRHLAAPSSLRQGGVVGSCGRREKTDYGHLCTPWPQGTRVGLTDRARRSWTDLVVPSRGYVYVIGLSLVTGEGTSHLWVDGDTSLYLRPCSLISHFAIYEVYPAFFY